MLPERLHDFLGADDGVNQVALADILGHGNPPARREVLESITSRVARLRRSFGAEPWDAGRKTLDLPAELSGRSPFRTIG